jgi:hypothetical protein
MSNPRHAGSWEGTHLLKKGEALTRELCTLTKRLVTFRSRPSNGTVPLRPFVHPFIRLGSRREYADWVAKARVYLRESGSDPASLDRVDATFNYARNRILLFNLPDARQEISVAETISHEVLHSLFEQLNERWAARALDQIAAPVGDPGRVGGI